MSINVQNVQNETNELAEKAVLGIALSGGEVDEVARRLKTEDFYLPAHKAIYDTCVHLRNNEKPIEPVIVLSEMHKNGLVKILPSGASYLTDLYSDAPPPSSLNYYIKLVKDASTYRSINILGNLAKELSTNPDGASPAEIIEQLSSQVNELANDRITTDVAGITEILTGTLNEITALQNGEGVSGIPTGFRDLDDALNGLHPGAMIIIAARPGIGKSSLALDIARNTAVRQLKSVLLFSLEMSVTELGMRALSAEAYVDMKSMRIENGIDDHKWLQLEAASERLQGKMLGIEDDPNVTIGDIKAKAKMWKQLHGLDLIVIDYIQLMNSDRRYDNRQQEVSEISRGIKLMAKELEIPVIALSQLNRSSEQRSDKKPALSDLRESGSLEQDADVVLLLHREDAYDRESPRAGEADVIIAKNRAGPAGTVVLSWLGKFSRFDNRTI